jgi:hypothetical protein
LALALSWEAGRTGVAASPCWVVSRWEAELTGVVVSPCVVLSQYEGCRINWTRPRQAAMDIKPQYRGDSAVQARRSQIFRRATATMLT